MPIITETDKIKKALTWKINLQIEDIEWKLKHEKGKQFWRRDSEKINVLEQGLILVKNILQDIRYLNSDKIENWYTCHEREERMRQRKTPEIRETETIDWLKD